MLKLENLERERGAHIQTLSTVTSAQLTISLHCVKGKSRSSKFRDLQSQIWEGKNDRGTLKWLEQRVSAEH